ncbi:MAG TPA: MFS transporter [Terracidiphilus sp.]|nr:MFS transporter [Terracidiphilus sp.]
MNRPTDSTITVATGPARTGRLRWWIVWTLFLSTVTNYISRQSFSVLSPLLTQQFHLSHTDLGKILSGFQIAYALTWLFGGMVLDSIGTRLGLAIAAAWWSIANILTGFSNSALALACFRFLLGIGEGFNWPGASKAVAEWFPREERSLAVAIFDSGSSVGGALAALVIPWIALIAGWRWSFAFAGSLGLLWVILWLWIYHPLERHPRVTAEEKARILAGMDGPRSSEQSGFGRWIQLTKNRNVWGVVLGRALTDPIWWFYVFWLPQYLSDARGFSLKQIAAFAWIPFIAADIGNFTGGWVSGLCIKRGISVLHARTWVCAVSCLPILAGIPAARVHSPYAGLALICVALWGYASWSTMGLTLPSDLFPHDVVATVTGFSGLAAGIVSALFTLAVGMLVDRFSYTPAFLAAGLLPLFATGAVFALLRAPSTQGSSTEPNIRLE